MAPEALSPVPVKEPVSMATPADTLVTQYPDRASQIRGPVYDYLKTMMPFSSAPQSLYMAVFYPAARNWPLNQQFPDSVQKVNPGIKTVQDYVNMVEAASNRSRPVLSDDEQAALDDTATALGLDSDTLYKQINFESGWNPQATNPYSGARGLIQFMPSTAKWMGYAAASIVPLILIAGLAFWYLKKQGYL